MWSMTSSASGTERSRWAIAFRTELSGHADRSGLGKSILTAWGGNLPSRRSSRRLSSLSARLFVILGFPFAAGLCRDSNQLLVRRLYSVIESRLGLLGRDFHSFTYFSPTKA